jgi:hypothetical protein
MPKPKLDKATRKAILEARTMIADIAKVDSNEAETRRRIERIFDTILGYDVFKHITREHAIHGVADTEHCDFAVMPDSGESETPAMIVEIKKVGINLALKHLKQVASYAINIGCEWVLLTNGREWRLHHITFGQPPQTKLIESWNLINDDPATLHKKFEIVSYKNLRKQGLDKLWEKRNVLTPPNMLKVLMSEDSIKLVQRGIKKATEVNVSPEDIVGSFRHLLNESALSEMDKLKISLPAKKQRTKKSKTLKAQAPLVEQEIETIMADKES